MPGWNSKSPLRSPGPSAYRRSESHACACAVPSLAIENARPQRLETTATTTRVLGVLRFPRSIILVTGSGAANKTRFGGRETAPPKPEKKDYAARGAQRVGLTTPIVCPSIRSLFGLLALTISRGN